jgi:probable rRNA maturation factor
MAISFHFNSVPKPVFFKPVRIRQWLKRIAAQEEKGIMALNYIFMNDEELLKLNMDYLNHDTYTDIITFDNAEAGALKIEGDIFISLERVAANAQKFNTTFENELLRVLAHGLLHLCGYKDKKQSDKMLMRKKEDDSLNLFLSAE